MTSTNPPPQIEVRHLTKHFPVRRGVFSSVVAHVKAVDDVSFSIPAGQTLGLVGESGCGKTTVGRTMLRLIEPTSGEVRYANRDLAKLSSADLRHERKNLQIVFQDPYSSLNPRLTVRSIVEEGLVIHRIGTPRERLDRVRETLETVGLDLSYMNRYPHEFSGGQRQRISIARALALEPKFLVLDEPISALDVSIQAQVINLLTELKERLKLTYLFISHDLSVVEYISDHVAVMYLGEIVERGTSAELYRTPLHPYTHALLSSAPTLETTKKKARIVLPGDVPSPLNPPAGCRFHPRCPLAMDVCKREKPPLLEIATHGVHCHVVNEFAVKSPNDAAALSAQIAAKMRSL